MDYEQRTQALANHAAGFGVMQAGLPNACPFTNHQGTLLIWAK